MRERIGKPNLIHSLLFGKSNHILVWKGSIWKVKSVLLMYLLFIFHSCDLDLMERQIGNVGKIAKVASGCWHWSVELGIGIYGHQFGCLDDV
jgi:hypothetical protein